MALKTCKDCDQGIAQSVKICPHCGGDQRNWAGRHPFISVAGGFFGFLFMIAIINTNGFQKVQPNDNTQVTNDTQTDNAQTDNNKQVEEKPAPAVDKTEETFKMDLRIYF